MNTLLHHLLALPFTLLITSAEGGSPTHPLTLSLSSLLQAFKPSSLLFLLAAASPSLPSPHSTFHIPHSSLLTLAYRPFLDPLQMKGATWWLLIIPLSLGVSVVYKAVRGKTMQGYWKNVLIMTVQIIGAMLLLGIGLHFVVEWLAPRLSS